MRRGTSLHAAVGGTVTVGFVLLSIFFYLLIAGVWNTGQLVDEKIQVQRTADAAAFAAATHMSRTLNQVTMQNMLVLRALAAEDISRTCLTVNVTGTIYLTAKIIYHTARAVSYTAQAAAAAAILDFVSATMYTGLATKEYVEVGILAADLAMLVQFWVECGKYASWGKFTSLATKLTADQKSLLTAETAAMVEDLQTIRDVYPADSGDFDLYVGLVGGPVMPTGSASLSGMVRTTSYTQMLTLLGLRLAVFDNQWPKVKSVGEKPKDSNSLPGLRGESGSFFSKFKRFKIRPVWYGSLAAQWLIVSGHGSRGHVLATHTGYQEWSVPPDRRCVSVVVVAVRRNVSRSFLAPGFFGQANPGDTVVAVAAAEAQNPYSDFFDVFVPNKAIGGLAWVGHLWPWRLWSSMGANWQPRLARVDPQMLSTLIQGQPELRDAWKQLRTSDTTSTNVPKDLILH